MTTFPLLLTLDHADGYRTYRWDYRRGRRLEEDRLVSATLLAEGAPALGWLDGWKPTLSPAGPLCRHSPDGRWRWRLGPRRPWPAPCQLWETDLSAGERERLVWNEAGWEICDLQLDPRGQGVYLAVRPPLGKRRLLHWNPRSQKATCVLSHADFQPLEFALYPDCQCLVFVHQRDDQVYRLDLASQQLYQLSIPQLEAESRDGYRVYRSSPAVSPDGLRVFYCTTYLELRDLELVHWGNLQVAPARGGALRRLPLEHLDDGCPVQICLPGRTATQQGFSQAS